MIRYSGPNTKPGIYTGMKYIPTPAWGVIRSPAKITADKDRIAARRGKNIAKIAAARKLLTLVYYGLRDGHIRALTRQRAAA